MVRGMDTYDIFKHQSDILRLALLLVPGEHVDLPPSLRDDLRSFIVALDDAPPDWEALRKSVGFGRSIQGAGIVALIRSVYELQRQ